MSDSDSTLPPSLDFDWGRSIGEYPDGHRKAEGFQLGRANRFVRGGRCIHKVSPPPKPVKPRWRYVPIASIDDILSVKDAMEASGWHYMKTEEIQYANPANRYDMEFWRRSGY